MGKILGIPGSKIMKIEFFHNFAGCTAITIWIDEVYVSFRLCFGVQNPICLP